MNLKVTIVFMMAHQDKKVMLYTFLNVLKLTYVDLKSCMSNEYVTVCFTTLHEFVHCGGTLQQLKKGFYAHGLYDTEHLFNNQKGRSRETINLICKGNC